LFKLRELLSIRDALPGGTMADFSPSKLAARNGEGAVADADAADDALEDDPVTTIGEAPNGQVDQRDKEALAQGLFHLFKPAVDNIDTRVKAVRQSQVELRAHIDNLADDLRRISDCRVVPIDLEPYVKKLLNTRRRIVAVASTLQTVQERVNKVNYYVNREKSKKNQMIKASTAKALDKAAATVAMAPAPAPSVVEDTPPIGTSIKEDDKADDVKDDAETNEGSEGKKEGGSGSDEPQVDA